MIPTDEQLDEWSLYRVKRLEFLNNEGAYIDLRLTDIEPLNILISAVRELKELLKECVFFLERGEFDIKYTGSPKIYDKSILLRQRIQEAIK
jgi:hypothetical protein